jgi:hypothetical protein
MTIVPGNIKKQAINDCLLVIIIITIIQFI